MACHLGPLAQAAKDQSLASRNPAVQPPAVSPLDDTTAVWLDPKAGGVLRLTSPVASGYVAPPMYRPDPSPGRARLDLLDPMEVSKLGGLEIITEGVVEGFLSGLHRSPRRGFSAEFAEHRMYQAGDDLRYVDWKILGRNDRLYVKQFEEETNLRAVIVCDTSRSMAWTGSPETILPKLAYARRLIAALALVLIRQRDATGLITFDDDVRTVTPPRARLSHWRQLLGVLGSLEAGQGTAAEPALRRVIGQLRRRGLVVFVSDLLLDRTLALKALRFLRHRGHQVLVIHIMDPAEVALTGPNEARFEDPETRAAVVLRPRDWAGAYRDTVRAVVSEWRLACRRHGIAYHRATTDTPFGVVLREALSPPSRST
jgi:uncharacterized protein (DUF58 family)